jgi:opacity protein-like surface antigen
MKKVLFVAVLISFMFNTVNAQMALSIYSGVGRSSFDKNIINNSITDLADFSQAQYVPIGAQLTYSFPFLLTLGADVNYSAVPFIFDVSANVLGQRMKISELEVHQLMAGIFVKARLLEGPIVPYAKAGAGLISGNIDIKWTDQFKQLASQYGFVLRDSTINIKYAIGVNLGAGLEINFGQSGGLFGEIVYYFVQREEDIKGAQSFQANSYGILVGWQFKFN